MSKSWQLSESIEISKAVFRKGKMRFQRYSRTYWDVMGAGGVGWCLLGTDAPQRSLEANRRKRPYGEERGAPPLISQRV